MTAGEIENRGFDSEAAGPRNHVAKHMFTLGRGAALDITEHRGFYRRSCDIVIRLALPARRRSACTYTEFAGDIRQPGALS